MVSCKRRKKIALPKRKSGYMLSERVAKCKWAKATGKEGIEERGRGKGSRAKG
jgi:hypothetical protein